MIREIKADMRRNGDAAMSVKEIAQKHGISTSSIYVLIGTKADLHAKH